MKTALRAVFALRTVIESDELIDVADVDARGVKARTPLSKFFCGERRAVERTPHTREVRVELPALDDRNFFRNIVTRNCGRRALEEGDCAHQSVLVLDVTDAKRVGEHGNEVRVAG